MSNLEKETLELFEELEKTVDTDMKPLLRSYKNNLNEIRGRIYSIWGEYAVNGEISISKAQRLKVMKELEKQLIEMAKELAINEEKIASNTLEELYSKSYYKTSYVIDKSIEFSVTNNFTLLSTDMIKAAVFQEYKGEMFSNRIWTNKKLLINRLKEVITNGIIQGKSVDKMAKEITKTFNSSAYESKRLIITEMARVTNEAQLKSYEDSNVVEKVMFVATLDNRTSENCRWYDGKLFNKNDNNKPVLPLHPNCRSRYIPIVNDYEPTKRIDNVTKDNVDYKNYQDWIKNLKNKV